MISVYKPGAACSYSSAAVPHFPCLLHHGCRNTGRSGKLLRQCCRSLPLFQPLFYPSWLQSSFAVFFLFFLLPAVRDHWDCPAFSFPRSQLQITLIKDVEAEGGSGGGWGQGGGGQVWLQFQILLDFLFLRKHGLGKRRACFTFFSRFFFSWFKKVVETRLQKWFSKCNESLSSLETGQERKRNRQRQRCVGSSLTDVVAPISPTKALWGKLRLSRWCREAEKMCQLS